jgi:hypothetical protein
VFLNFSGFLLEFIPIEIGAGMTLLKVAFIDRVGEREELLSKN